MKDGDALKPVTVLPDVTLVPEELLKVVKCGCNSTFQCQSTNCNCHKAGMPCTEFCKCCGETGQCFNPNTKHLEDDTDDDDTDDSTDDSDTAEEEI